MQEPTPIVVGMDVHQEEVVLAVLRPEERSPTAFQKLRNEPVRIRRFLRKVAKAGPIHVCYEASGCGYVLQRALASWGYPCTVIAPSLAPRRSGDRVKTDRRDAERLAMDFRAGLLTAIHVPGMSEERVRGLTRAHETLSREIRRSRQYILKFLQVRGVHFRPEKSANHWSPTH